MNLTNLLGKGYFCEELPPAFTTANFALQHRKISSIVKSLTKEEFEKLKETDFVRFSVPRVGIQRRINGIPNPFHQFQLSLLLYKNWSKIRKHYRRKNLSASIPDEDKSGKRAIIQFSKYELFKEKCIEASFDALFELRGDISKYFSSIYTHSIPWALHTKAIGKAKRFDKKLLGNLIDQAIRFGQSGQTIGIPIGTDTSRIVAEILGCAIDDLLLTALSKEKILMKGFRFVDDIHFFFHSQADAEICLKHFRRILDTFSLNIKEEKTFVNKSPFVFDNAWSHTLNNFRFRSASKFQRIDLKNYTSLLIQLSQQYLTEPIIKYGVKRLIRLKIADDNWKLYESLLFSLAGADGAILPDLLTVLLRRREMTNKGKLESLIKSILAKHVYRGNHFEVSWSLWIARTFRIKIPLSTSNEIASSRDIVSILILLDLRSLGLVPKKIALDTIKLEMNESGLVNEYWLLIYEGRDFFL
jgi:hypothetical protein